MKRNTTNIILAFLFALSCIAAFYIVLNNRIRRHAYARTPISKIFHRKSSRENSIAVISISGPIFMGQRSRVLSGTGSPRQIIKKLKLYGSRDDVKAIILRINSPGGSVASVQEIYEEIIRTKKKNKVIVASFGDVSASGGYYIAAAADKIVANPGTITGSIGVIMQSGNFQELFKKIGVKFEIIKSGKFKDSGSPHRALTPEERRIFQQLIDDAYDQFIVAIMEGRGMSRQAILKLATGRVFTGRQALKVGLIDALGGLQRSIEIAAELAGITGEPHIIDEVDPWLQVLSLIDNMLPDFSFPLSRALIENGSFRLDYLME